MRIATNRRDNYSIRAVIEIALHHHDPVRRKARDIALDADIPRHYVAQILGPLVRAGILDGLAGPDGGYRLSREPSEITLLEVVEAVEGAMAPPECLLSGGPCDESALCQLHAFWTAARAAFVAQLTQLTFADLTIQGGQRSGTPAFPPAPR